MGKSLAYNREFFRTWSADMSYVLGFLYADGNIVKTQRGNHYIALYSADESLLYMIRKTFGSKHKVSMRNARSGFVYRIQIGSKEWFSDLEQIGVHPGKTKRMQLPKIPKEYFGDFVRGYFDGDGNVWSGTIHKKREKTTQTLQVAFTSGSNEFLVSLHKALFSQGIIGGSFYVPKTKNFTRFSLSMKDALKLYKIMYNTSHKLYLNRKKCVFEQFMKLRS